MVFMKLLLRRIAPDLNTFLRLDIESFTVNWMHDKSLTSQR